MHKLLFITACLLLGVVGLQAQKYGHTNGGNIIALMPESKAADQELQNMQTQLIAQGEKMAEEFQKKVTKLLEEVQTGTISPSIQAQREAALQQDQQKIYAFEQEIAQRLATRRDELLAPIIQKASDAIEAVAKEGGYTMIFDTSTFNAILFAEDSDDITNKVKAKLGIQ